MDEGNSYSSAIFALLQYISFRFESRKYNETTEMRAFIADFWYACKTSDRVRRYGLKAFNRPPEARNVNGHCPSVDGKTFDN